MPYCFVPSCRSGNPKYTKQLKADGKGIPRFFTAPNQELLHIWNTKIKRSDKQLTMSDSVCSNHFSANDVVLFFETRLPDGTINRIPRDRAKLKDGAIPHIFEGYPSHRRTVTKREKFPIASKMKSVTKGVKNAKIEIETAAIHLEEVNKSERNEINFLAEEDTCENPYNSVPSKSSITLGRAPDDHKRSARSKVRLLRRQTLTEKQARPKDGAIPHIIQGHSLHHRRVAKREKSPMASAIKAITMSKQNSTIEIKSTGLNLEEVKESDNTEIPSQAEKDINPGKSVPNKCTTTCSKVGLLNSICFQVEEDTNLNLAEKQAKLKDGAIPHIVQEYPLCRRKLPKREKSPMVSAMKSIITSKQNSTIEIKSTGIHIEEVKISDRAEIPSQAEKDINPGKSVLNICTPTFQEASDDKWSCSKVGLLNLPTRWVVCNTPHTGDKVLVHINDDIEIDKSIKFQDKADVEIKVKGIDCKSGLQFKIETVEDAQNLVRSINRLRVCCGTDKNSDPSSTHCFGVTKSQNQMRCDACSNERERRRKRAARLAQTQARAQEKKLKISSRLKQLEKSKSRLMLRVKALKAKITEAMIQCKAVKKKSLEEAISQLPAAQQEAVKVCFDAAKNKGPYGRRYTMQWANKCLLMRIKSPKLYDYIRTQNILPLPVHSTLATYTRNIGEASSLQHLTVDMIKRNTTDADEIENCEGEIIFDEKELTPSTTSDAANLLV